MYIDEQVSHVKAIANKITKSIGVIKGMIHLLSSKLNIV